MWVKRATTALISRKKIRPPSSAGMGRRFITARLMAMKATRLITFCTACMGVADWLPTSPMVLTIPMGPERSRKPTAPRIRSPRLNQTMRT